MSTIEERQESSAQQLVRKLDRLPIGSSGWIHLAGAEGAGKTTVLNSVRELLPKQNLRPIFINPPSRELDTAAIGLLQIADQLKSYNLANGDLDCLQDPRTPWRTKQHAVIAAIDRSADEVVMLCDEPRNWYDQDESRVVGTSDFDALGLSDWIIRNARCRRIITGRIPADLKPESEWKPPRIQDGPAFLKSYSNWGPLQDFAAQLEARLFEAPRSYSAWEMKLAVALTYCYPVDECVQLLRNSWSPLPLLQKLMTAFETQPDLSSARHSLLKLSLARSDVDRTTIQDFTQYLAPQIRSIVEDCLLEWRTVRGELHPQVRYEIARRARDLGQAEARAQWRLLPEDRRLVHLRLAQDYSGVAGLQSVNLLESFHHDVLSSKGESLDEHDRRLQFVEQLHGIGRLLSLRMQAHAQAVKVFRMAIQLEDMQSYSHHYLAFNLDYLAQNPVEIEEHYQKAIQLQPKHPWRHSRWITYLATRGQNADALKAWESAIDCLEPSDDDSSKWIYQSLHRWVARWLLHWGELDFAEGVLRSIPEQFVDRSVEKLWDLLMALRQAEQGVSVFPLTVSPSLWWKSETPFSNLSRTWCGRHLSDWLPARVEQVDLESNELMLLAARRPKTVDAKPTYIELVLSRSEVEKAAQNFVWDELFTGRFVELGAYQTESSYEQICLHKETEWRDPELLPLVPPADRWYHQAVRAAARFTLGEN